MSFVKLSVRIKIDSLTPEGSQYRRDLIGEPTGFELTGDVSAESMTGDCGVLLGNE